MPNDLDPVQLLNAQLSKDLSSFILRCFATVAPGNPISTTGISTPSRIS